jgi:hypothetical protein
MAEIDITQVDRDLLAIGRFSPYVMHRAHRPSPSIWMVYGWIGFECQGVAIEGG